MTKDETNRKLHEWRGLCWHTPIHRKASDGGLHVYCGKCGEQLEIPCAGPVPYTNPDYLPNPWPLKEKLEADGWLTRLVYRPDRCNLDHHFYAAKGTEEIMADGSSDAEAIIGAIEQLLEVKP